MPYLFDRRAVLWTHELVAVLQVRQSGGARSRVVLQDNSLYHTLTRARTFLRSTETAHVFMATRTAHTQQQRGSRLTREPHDT